MSAKRKLKAVPVPQGPLRLDLGCGKNKREGFIGVDQYAMDGVDVQCKLSQTPWEFDKNVFGTSATDTHVKDDSYAISGFMLENDSVEEVNCSHFVEHLTAPERIHFVNELYRVLKPGGKATVVVPHWCSNRAYGDLTHQWPPVSEMWFYYLSKEWRATNAPHLDSKFNPDGYICDFECQWGYAMHQGLQSRNQEYQMHALTFWKEAAQDIMATMTKKA